MTRDDEYRRNAAEAQKQADAAKTENDRAAWLHLTQGWLSLIRNRPPTDEEIFADAVTSRATGQETSEKSQ